MSSLFSILPSNINLLYLHMIMSAAYICYDKTLLKKWLLAFTFIISFFTLSGYVNGGLHNGKSAPQTTVLTYKSTALKSGISYKSVALALYKPQPSYLATIKHFNQSNRTYLNLIASKYSHLKWVYSSIKSNINYLLQQQPYSTRQDHILTNFNSIC